jgi:Tol biopolymer transport system component
MANHYNLVNLKIYKKEYLKRIVFALFLFCLSFSNLYAQFGKNKVNYEKFQWLEITTENFDIYYPEGSYNIAEFTGWTAEESLKKIQASWNYDLIGRIIIVVYPSHNTFQNNNVGWGSPSESTGGFTEFMKNRVVIPFQGSYTVFRHVIHHELTHAVMLRMDFGEGVQSVISGISRMPIPLWFIEGLAEYESNGGWTNESDLYLRDAIINDYLMPIPYLQGYFIYKGGQSVLYYLAEQYGHEKVGELQRSIRQRRDFNTALKDVLGFDLEELNKRWHRSLKREIWPTAGYFEAPSDFAVKMTDHEEWFNFINTSPAISPDGGKIAVLSDKDDYLSIFIINTVSGKIEKKLLTGGGRLYLFEQLLWLRPWIDWSPDGNELVFVGEAGPEDAIYTIDIESGEITHELRLGMQGIFSPNWSPDSKSIVFSGQNNGQTDLYTVNLEDPSSLKNLTNDTYSDYDPDWGENGKILFVSERGDDLSIGKDVDMWKYDYHKTDVYTIDPSNSQITRITNDDYEDRTPNWTSKSDIISIVTDRTGANNIYLKDLNSSKEWAITDVLTGAFTPSWSNAGTVTFASFHEGGYDVFLYKNPFDEDRKMDPKLTYFQKKERGLLEEEKSEKVAGSKPASLLPDFDDLKIDIGSFMANNIVAKIDTSIYSESKSKKDDENSSEEDSTEADPGIRIISGSRSEAPAIGTSFNNYEFYPEGWDQPVRHVEEYEEIEQDSIFDANGDFIQRKYKVRFTPDIVGANAGYSAYFGLQGYGQIMFSDILGNHIIMMALNMNNDFENSNVAFNYVNLTGRYDYGVGAFHNAYFFNYYRDRNYGASASITYPISRNKRFDLSAAFINIDRDRWDVNRWDYIQYQKSHFVLPTVSYVYDNSLWGWTAPINGQRFKISFSYSPDIDNSKKDAKEYWGIDFKTLSFDARKYYHVGYDYSFAFRVSGSTSWGENPQRFFLGGVSNWINRRFVDGEVRDDIDDVYFSSFATPVRGANYYERYGNTFLLSNNEFRFPLIRQMIFGWPLPMFFYNIRGAVFCDIGAAWDYTKFSGITTNEQNETEFNDIVMGYGWGARFDLGIFIVKWDMAWRHEFYRIHKPTYFVSLGTDF